VLGEPPLDVLFMDLSTAGDFPIEHWYWDFGDEFSSTASDPMHIYEQVGSYTVTLSVTTAAGSDTEIKQEYITVREGLPTLEFLGVLSLLSALMVLGSKTIRRRS